MKQFTLCIIFLLGVLSSCRSTPSDTTNHWEEIAGREENLQQREPLYRIRVPLHWRRLDPKPGETIEDTTKPLCEFFIDEGEKSVRIAIHNFASKIPPMAQIARWQKQVGSKQTIIPQSFSGYVGFLFDASDKGTLGWAMQLGPLQYQMLPDGQMRADITIKATGPAHLIEKYRHEIAASARTFELKEEIPAG